MKLPKIYYGYKKLLNMWKRQVDSEEKQIMIECLNQSLKEIVELHMAEFEKELYKEVA